MARMEPLEVKDTPEFMQEKLQVWQERMGYVPNTILTMARKPKLVQAMAMLSEAVHNDSSLPATLRGLIGLASSAAAGCMFCTAHSAAATEKYGADREKVAKYYEYETNDLFSDAERAAMRYAQRASSTPNAVTDESFAELRKYFSDTEIVEIQAVVSYYGFLNRWNDSFATTLEQQPLDFANAVLEGQAPWSLGKHG